MDEKKHRGEWHFPLRCKQKKLQEDYSKNTEEMEEGIFKEYAYMVLSLLCVFNVGFWVSYFWMVMLL